MKTVSFYAYRGGTGRTLCAVNCATELASQGKKVLFVDLDLKSGGAAIVFHGDVPMPRLEKKSQEFFKEQEQPKGLSAFFLSKGIIGKNVIENLNINDKYAGLVGLLNFIPIYINEFQSDMIQLSMDSPSRFASLVEKLKRDIDQDYEYDYLIFDLPTGSNEIYDKCFGLSDLVVVMSRPNMQGAYGTGRTIEQLMSKRIPSIVVISSVPGEEATKPGVKIHAFIKKAFLVVNDISIIPFDESLAFFEDIPVLDRPNEPVSISYKKIVQRIIEGN